MQRSMTLVKKTLVVKDDNEKIQLGTWWN